MVRLFSLMGSLLVVLGWLAWDAQVSSSTTASDNNRVPLPNNDVSSSSAARPVRQELLLVEERRRSDPSNVEDQSNMVMIGSISSSSSSSCPYASFEHLTPQERRPRAGSRHMVDPPAGGRQTLVCCTTTKGPWSIVVHEAWAKWGARRFLEMVRTGYFSNKVPLMRCIRNFLCQFGLAGPPSKQFDKKRLPDDPNWLPEGPAHRTNAQGVKRFAQGYLAYAGAGKESRSSQLIVALQANARLAGGSPWEVPWGELVGTHSFDTLSRIYTGYGDKGPPQGRLRREGASDAVAKDFPLLDYILSCQVMDEVVDEAAVAN